MHYLALIFLLIPLSSTASTSAELETACAKLFDKSADQKKCMEHSQLFEVSPNIISACHKNFVEHDHKTNCLKSGANEQSMKECTALPWKKENILTCLRVSPSHSLLESCRQFSSKEETAISCIRTGRESAQIIACKDWGSTEEEKIECLRLDIPAEEIRICLKNAQKNSVVAKKCLLNYTADREQAYNKEISASRQEIQKRMQEENKRMPASIRNSK